jgi:hypothetical protein
MNGNDGRVEERRASDLPWYRRNQVWFYGLPILALLVILYLFYWPLQVTRGPWQVLDPGRPADDPLKFEVVQEGTGPVVEAGDLVQISRWRWSPEEERIEQRDDDWWVWVGFRTAVETPFYAMNPQLLSALIGQREGAAVKFTESPSYIEERGGLRQIERSGTSAAGKVYINPFGSYNNYAVMKSSYSDTSRIVYIPFRPNSGYTIVYIKKVFKGQLKYRTTHLYDTTWFRRCRWFTCEYVNSPREAWYDDARYEGVSADGQRATFQYGPVETPGTGKLRTGGGMRGWDQNEWKSLPKGVQVE